MVACTQKPAPLPEVIEASQQKYVEDQVREVILKDGTRCVTVTDKAITCEWRK